MNNSSADRYFYNVGRFLLGLYFLLPGLAKVFLFQDNLDVVVLREVPLPSFSLSLVAITQIFFGTMLMVGKYVHMGALVLAVVTLLINFYIHDFWNMSGDANQAHETQNFVKNLGILAGLLVLSKKGAQD
ncbi:DoxX family membrane protein [Gammaproteobacteria bacterium]|nr:DoxX family membrane protein [Gammaproteobacteria bacterium]